MVCVGKEILKKPNQKNVVLPGRTLEEFKSFAGRIEKEVGFPITEKELIALAIVRFVRIESLADQLRAVRDSRNAVFDDVIEQVESATPKSGSSRPRGGDKPGGARERTDKALGALLKHRRDQKDKNQGESKAM